MAMGKRGARRKRNWRLNQQRLRAMIARDAVGEQAAKRGAAAPADEGHSADVDGQPAAAAPTTTQPAD